MGTVKLRNDCLEIDKHKQKKDTDLVGQGSPMSRSAAVVVELQRPVWKSCQLSHGVALKLTLELMDSMKYRAERR